MSYTLEKQPGEARLYDIDFTALLVGGLTIASAAAVTATNLGRVSGSAALVLSGQVFSGVLVQVRLSGGTHLEEYRIVSQVTDTGNNILEAEFILLVRDLGVAPAGFIVETGAIVAAANSYVGLGDANAYHTLMGTAGWTAAADEAKYAALIKAARYLDGVYGGRFKGEKVEFDQPMEWPRVEYTSDWPYDLDEIPQCVLDAQCELASRQVSAPLVEDVSGRGEVASETVGPIARSFFQRGSSAKSYPEVDVVLAPVLTGGRGTIPLERG